MRCRRVDGSKNVAVICRIIEKKKKEMRDEGGTREKIVGSGRDSFPGKI